MEINATGLVTYRLDPNNPPALTAEAQQAWTELQEMGDEGIDYSDIPPLPTTGWRYQSRINAALRE